MDSMLGTILHKVFRVPACDVTMNNGVLRGNGYYMIKTLTQTKLVSLPWTIDENGPAEISAKACSSFVVLEPKIHFYWIIPAILFFILLLSIPVSYKYFKLKRKMSKYDYKSKMSCSGMIFDGPMGKRRINIFKLILYSYGLTRNVIDACITPKVIIGNNSLFAVTMWPGDTLCTTNGFLRYNPTLIQLPLVLEYETGLWEHERESSWGCVSGSCPSDNDCTRMRNSLPTVVNNQLQKSFCTNYPKSCALGHGCWFGKDKIKYSVLGKVFRFASNFELESNGLTGENCKGVRSLGTTLSVLNMRIVKWEDTYFLCPTSSTRGNPRVGQIGDIQISGSEVRFDWNSIQCDDDWFRTEKCLSRKPTVLNNSCVKFPAVSGGVKFHNDRDLIYASLDSDSSLIVGSCTGNFLSKESDCYNIKIKMIGMRGSQIGLSLVVSALSKNNSESTIISINCTVPHEVHFPCDGENHFIVLSESDKCIGLLDETKIMLGFGDYVTEDHPDSIIGFLSLHNHKLALYSSFWLFIILVIILTYCCCCKTH